MAPGLLQPSCRYIYSGEEEKFTVKFDTIREPDTNLTRLFLRVWVEYNRVLVKFVLSRMTRLINGLYKCQSM